MPGKTKCRHKSRKRLATTYPSSMLPITRSRTAVLGNYDVWRSELEAKKDINEICAHLNVSLETLFIITRGTSSSPDLYEKPPTSPSVATLLEEKCMHAREASAKPNRNERTSQLRPKEQWTEAKKIFPERKDSNDFRLIHEHIFGGARSKQEYSNLEETLSDPDNSKCPSEPNFRNQTTVFPSKQQSSFTFDPLLAKERGKSLLRTETNLEKSGKFWPYVFALRKISNLKYYCSSNFAYTLLFQFFCNLRNFLVWVYDVI
ncbi:hypothetical protein HNY73_020482 [Argiope bruennichi]|uniref:Uncharacterized protein n=1 Tax=Argiope bruennichi TaxID=94029 RepID=A0A8T0EAS0_ARGBR|nr:hypothetical protein HNY73_020482 [Argiope bruennichi]